MEEFTLMLNDFLFNSGILGFYRIMKHVGKEKYLTINENTITIKPEALENFTQDYFETMMYFYEEETRWHKLVETKQKLLQLNLDEESEILEKIIKDIKTAIESNSYKAGYTIALQKENQEDIYQLLKDIQQTKEKEVKRENAIKILEHLENNKEIYCMKDIAYNKINTFWNNVAFLERNSNKTDMKISYQEKFVSPVNQYLQKQSKSDYTCIECGREVSKSQTNTMSWLSDTGVDYNKKNSAYWGFHENTFLCPICSLIYSCVPLGFNMMGSNGIFVNNNESIELLERDNNQIKVDITTEQNSFDTMYQKIFYNILNRTNQLTNKEYSEYEYYNIQVIKRDATDKDNKKYEFNLISKDKLLIFNRTQNSFKNLLNKKIKVNETTISIYGQVLNNFLNNKKQYPILHKLILKEITDNIHLPYIKDIIKIQLYCIGGKNVKELEEYNQEIKKEGENLQGYFFANNENVNKLNSYRYKLAGALRRNSVEDFMKIFTSFYDGMGLKMPRTNAIMEMINTPENFKILGYSYVYGLGKMLDKKEEKQENEGGLEDEE